MGTITDNIGGSTIYTSLAIHIKNKYRKLSSVFFLYTTRYILIVNEINIVKLDMLSDIIKQLTKACSIFNKSTAIFGGLPILIIIGDFYQFSLIRG